MNSISVPKPVKIDLNIGDQLTSISCGHIVVELIKFVVYQRQQIPYTYPWLKQVINKKKLCEDQDVKESFQSEIHYRVASTALENLDFILKSLLQEINSSSLPSEVCIALGGTPVTCKEVYRFILPTACHKPQCHSTLIATDQKIQKNVFRLHVALTADPKVQHLNSNIEKNISNTHALKHKEKVVRNNIS
ncbi:MAD2L1-binding protein [Operophtera brumata]|uniref:MAD2L1-binding protein n=1 Tax=Operophtera brumata TaxID=104452 RepID=A0A0L7KPJ1_OPEBR|nr:MAD2L1-binding protein [Operophtera brumata]